MNSLEIEDIVALLAFGIAINVIMFVFMAGHAIIDTVLRHSDSTYYVTKSKELNKETNKPKKWYILIPFWNAYKIFKLYIVYARDSDFLLSLMIYKVLSAQDGKK